MNPIDNNSNINNQFQLNDLLDDIPNDVLGDALNIHDEWLENPLDGLDLIEFMEGNLNDQEIAETGAPILNEEEINGNVEDPNVENIVDPDAENFVSFDFLGYNEIDVNPRLFDECIKQFDVGLLSSNDTNANGEEIHHGLYSVLINYDCTTEMKKYEIDNEYQMSDISAAPSPDYFLPGPISPSYLISAAPSPSYSESSAKSFDSLSSGGINKKSKRGRKPKDWKNSTVTLSMLESAKTQKERNKAKNNISSGLYRGRKAEERKKLENKISILEQRNIFLQQKLDRNITWLRNAELLFPDISIKQGW